MADCPRSEQGKRPEWKVRSLLCFVPESWRVSLPHSSPNPVCVGGWACLAAGSWGGIGRLDEKGLNGGPSVQRFPAAPLRDGWSPSHTPQTTGPAAGQAPCCSPLWLTNQNPLFLLDFSCPPRILSSMPSQQASPLSYPSPSYYQ